MGGEVIVQFLGQIGEKELQLGRIALRMGGELIQLGQIRIRTVRVFLSLGLFEGVKMTL